MSTLGARLYVGNIKEGVTDGDLKARAPAPRVSRRGFEIRIVPSRPPPAPQEAFEKYGKLVDVWIARKPAGFGFVSASAPPQPPPRARGGEGGASPAAPRRRPDDAPTTPRRRPDDDPTTSDVG